MGAQSKGPLTQLSAANVAPTAKRCYDEIALWQQSMHRFGAAEFHDGQEECAFEPLRKAAARFLNCGSPGEICGGSSCTELLGSLAWGLADSLSLGRSHNVVGCAACFPSTLYPFARVAESAGAEMRLVGADPGSFVTDEGALLEAIDESTRIVALSHVEFTSGQVYDLARVAGHLREATGGRGFLVVDGSQSVGVLDIDIGRETAAGPWADAVAVTGYKWLCGSFGAAAMWVGDRVMGLPHAAGRGTAAWAGGFRPGLVGFRSHRDMWATDATRLELPAGARRFEFATVHFGAILGLARCFELLQELGGSPAVWAHALHLADYLIAALESSSLSPEKCEVVWPSRGSAAGAPAATRSAIVSLRLKGPKGSGEVEAELKDSFGIIVTKRGPFLRVSPHVYNGTGCVDRLVGALAAIL